MSLAVTGRQMVLSLAGHHDEHVRVSLSWINRVGPGVTLLLLAPLLGELVSGHQSLFQFLNPISFVLLALPYGFGALLCRELTVRWRKGWVGLLLLALAYGVYEEALVARSIWDPHWAELGAVGNYSFWHGVTWTYAAVLLHFHVTVSIGASVVLAHLIHPNRRHDVWLSPVQLTLCAAGLALWMPALVLLHPFRPPLWAITVAALSITCLVIGARRARDPEIRPRPERSVRPVWYGVLAALNTTVVFVVVFMLPEAASSWRPPWPVSLGAVVLADALTAWVVLRWSGGARRWDDRHKLALVIGVLAFFIVFGGLQDFEEGFGGHVIVAILTVAALWRLWRVTARRVGSAATQQADDI
jgi:hypothetical protein